MKIGERSSRNDLRVSITSFGLVFFDVSQGNQKTSIQSFNFIVQQYSTFGLIRGEHTLIRYLFA
jgi:hypothetical protein